MFLYILYTVVWYLVVVLENAVCFVIFVCKFSMIKIKIIIIYVDSFSIIGYSFIFLAFFLPKLSFILKARHKKLQKGLSEVFVFSREQVIVTVVFNSFVETVIYYVKSALLRSIDQFTISLNSFSDIFRLFVFFSSLKFIFLKEKFKIYSSDFKIIILIIFYI